MTYQECIDYLYSALPVYQRQGPAAYKDNLDNTLRLDEYFGHPHRQFPSVHLAGTNGKGSVSHMLASVLQAAGYRTGLYTSPHLLDFRERIRVNGEPIGEKEVLGFVESHRGIIEGLKPSFFEITVAMAFEHFARHKVDIAVVETGLGGRLDSTNILQPLLSVITNISLDHQIFLGDRLSLIAGEKAGIIKTETPVVIGKAEDEVMEVFQAVAREKKAPLVHAAARYRAEFRTLNPDGSMQLRISRLEERPAEEGSGARLGPREAGQPEGTRPGGGLHTLHCDLVGSYQDENILTALTALDELRNLGWVIGPLAEKEGFRAVSSSTGLRGRWECIGNNPRSICDTGHNPAGVEAIVEQIRQTPHRLLHMVWGMVGDKDIDEVLSLLPEGASYYFTPSTVPRSMDPVKLQQKAEEHGLKGRAYGSVAEAYSAARKAAGADDLIFTGGSTFVVADLLAREKP